MEKTIKKLPKKFVGVANGCIFAIQITANTMHKANQVKNVLSLQELLSILKITDYTIPNGYTDRAIFNKGQKQHLIVVNNSGISLNSGKPGDWWYHSFNNSYMLPLDEVQSILNNYK